MQPSGQTPTQTEQRASSLTPRRAAPAVARLDELTVTEQIGDEIHVSPRPALAHANAAGQLLIELDGPFRKGRGGPGGWILLIEPELHLVGSRPVVPDLAGWRRERLPKLPRTPALTLVPDWVCEVLSPGSARWDRGRKLPFYAEQGVNHLWLLDPIEQSLEVYRRTGPLWTLLGTFLGGAPVHAEPFEALPLDLDSLWADLEPDPEHDPRPEDAPDLGPEPR